jgi:serine/threonine protein kinase/tetratricopeptide (TPR) repeat protein
MTSCCADRNLLFGITALQMSLIGRDQLIDAMQEWDKDKSRTLGEVLTDRWSMTIEECERIDRMIANQDQHQDGSLESSWSDFPLISPSNVAVVDTSAAPPNGAGAVKMVRGGALAAEPVMARAPGRPEVATSRYRVIRPHAAGGLGRVHLAEDTELHRRVALKEIQPNHAEDPVSRERFVFEAEVTGNLEHPGIVPVYDLGWRPNGRPFYAMRFIEGEDLAAAARRFHAGSLPDFFGREFRWLLRRFVDVCNTIGYAHSRGVLHRDIKPGNIMLGPFGETLVMDWGVAKPLGGPEADAASRDNPYRNGTSTIRPHWGSSSVTLAGQAVGTPAYMSPEQAAGRPDLLGPASDVYSLGATLYVLLTHQPPFSGDPNDVLRKVRQGCFDAPRAILPGVPRDLDAICLKAMAAEPSRRYASALALADDVELWLADEPVTACREPNSARARRWVKRHQPIVAGVAASVVVAMAALALAVPVLSMAWRNQAEARRDESRQRVVALQKAAEANEQRMRAEKALKFLVDAFRKPDPAVDGRSLKVIDLLDRAVKDLDSSMAGQPLMQATLYNAIGETFSALGLSHESSAAFARAVDIRRHLLGQDHPETLESCQNLAMSYQDGGRLDRAIPILKDTLSRRGASLGDDHDDTIESMNDLAVAYWEAGRPEEAIPLFEELLPRVRARLGADHPDALTIMDNLAVAYTAADRPDRAIPLHQSVLAGFRAKLGDDHLATLVAMNNLAKTNRASGQLDEAIRLLETTSSRLGAKLGEDHPTTLTAMHSLAAAYQDAGQLDRAVPLSRAVLSKRRAKLGDDHPDTLLSILTLTNQLFAERRTELAIPLLREFLDRAHQIETRLPVAVRDAIPKAARRLADLDRRGNQDGLAESSPRTDQGPRPATRPEGPGPASAPSAKAPHPIRNWP